MSKSLKKLIDINRLREFKNKLVGVGSAYVQTAAVDQTIAGTKTFSKPIVGSVTGSSGSCTGNAATATKATQDAAGNTITTTYATKAHTHTKSQITDFPALATVATSGSYTDLANKPAIPTVNNATLTIQKNGTTVKTFTANSSTNVTANITVPTKVSDLTNDSGYITSSGSCNYANSAGSAPANGGTSTASAYLNDYGTLQYGVNRLQYFNISTTTTSGASNVANPTNDWYYHIIQSHANSYGYYFDIASHFHGNNVYYRRIAGGQESGWIQFIDSGNIGSQSVNYANSAGYANWLRTSSHSDHLFHTEWDGRGYFWTYVTAGDGSYRAVRVARSDSAATAEACTGNAATATKATQDAAGNTITTTYATKAENNTKANNSEVVHKSGDETIAGTKTFNDTVHASGFHSTATNAFMAQRGEYTLVLRNDGADTYLLMSDKGGVPGTWSNARPLVIHNSTGVCDINGNSATATKLATARTIALSDAVTGTATAFDGSGNITIPVTALAASAIRAQWYAAYPDGPEAHNAMWGGRDITAYFNDGIVSANIANGTFKDIFPGDYIRRNVTISGKTYKVNWVIADCDYWINKGDTATTAHHVVIVPQAPIFNANMNATNTTEGGYAGSRMYKETIPACARGIVHAFGSDHILTFGDGISNSVDTSHISSGLPQLTGTPGWWGTWVSAQCSLMSEKMVYGAPICSAGAMDNAMATRQMSAFRLSEKLINYDRQWWWLRDVVSSAAFARAGGDGFAGAGAASDVGGVRPFALLV